MQHAFVLPYLRISPVHIPRRDLVIGGADNVLLEIGVVEYDDPTSQALVVTGGIGGPSLRMTVFPDSFAHRSWDYASPTLPRCSVLWSGVGTVSAQHIGTFEMRIPIGSMMSWPLRCAYSLQLDWDGAMHSDTLAQGFLHVRRAVVTGTFVEQDLLTDDSVPILTSNDLTHVEA